MSKELCILHANCQGDALLPLLEASPEYARHFETRHYTNYRQPEVAERDLAECKLFLHQYLAPKWGDGSTEHTLEKLAPFSQAITLPNFFFSGYWPFWTNATAEIEFADSLLEKLLASKISTTELLALYLSAPEALSGDMEGNAMESLRREKEKEKKTPIKYLGVIEENWRDEQLFITVNHPGKRLLFHTAQEILKILDFKPLPVSVLQSYEHPQNDFWLPIHPVAGTRLKISFAGPDRKYNCFGKPLTHREYVSVYLACRQHGIKDLTGVLKTLSEKKIDAKIPLLDDAAIHTME